MINSKIRTFTFRKSFENNYDLNNKNNLKKLEKDYYQTERTKQNINTVTFNENSINYFLKNKTNETKILNINNNINYNNNNIIINNTTNINNNLNDNKNKEYFLKKLKKKFRFLKYLVILSYSILIIKILLIFIFPNFFCCFMNIFSLLLVLIFLFIIFMVYVKEYFYYNKFKKLLSFTKKIIFITIFILLVYIIDILYIIIVKFLLNSKFDYEMSTIIKILFFYLGYIFFNLLCLILILNTMIKIFKILKKINKFELMMI